MAETENKTVTPKSNNKDKKRLVKALFSYTPVNIDELQLKVNDILEVIEETEEGWWKGILNGVEGMFPSNFVIELNNLSEELNNHAVNELSPTTNLTKIKNTDIHDSPGFKQDISHSPSTKHDTKFVNLSSNSDDVFDSAKISEKSTIGKKNTVDTTAPRLPPKPVREQARVIYPYTALNEDELSLKEGDIITVISKEVEDKGWWKGELNNKTGVFPDNFVQLIKVEEQKKPERPDKPSSALTSRASTKSSSDKSGSEFSPKIDKKNLKTPPVKPPPPEIHKKEHERPTPPFPMKKPQVPHPMKKPTRSSLGSKFSGFSPPAAINVAKPVPEVASTTLPSNSTLETKSEVSKTVEKTKSEISKTIEKTKSEISKTIEKTKSEISKNIEKTTKSEISKTTEKTVDKEDKKDTKKENQDLGFEGLESSGKKLVHLTANRAKVPNRRPPSHIFLRESEKENGLPSDPRRLSEPLLSEMKSILQLGATPDSNKANITTTNEVKTKVPPSRPVPPSIRSNKPVTQGSVVLTKTISSEECIVKAPEPIKKAILPDTSNLSGSEILQPKKLDLISSDFKVQTSDREIQELKERIKTLMETMVSRGEFNELAKQVKELKENLEKCNNSCRTTINDLRSELELERKMRLSLEIELQQIKDRQTT